MPFALCVLPFNLESLSERSLTAILVTRSETARLTMNLFLGCSLFG